MTAAYHENTDLTKGRNKLNDTPSGEISDLTRRKRYERSGNFTPVTMTPLKFLLLQTVFEFRILSLPQVAALMDWSEQSARRHLRELYDARLLERIAVTRAELADSSEPNDASLLHGSAPNIHAVSRQGVELLIEAGFLDKSALRLPIPKYGPQNTLFLRHELMIQDVRIWLKRLVHADSQNLKLLSWKQGNEADIVLSGNKTVKPDARFVIQIGTENDNHPLILSCIIEVDRGTERGYVRWAQKLESYNKLYSDTNIMIAKTGYRHARLLVLTTRESRLCSLADKLESIIMLGNLSGNLYERIWLINAVTINQGTTLCTNHWRILGVEGLWPLLHY